MDFKELRGILKDWLCIERFRGSKSDIVDLWDLEGYQGICGLRGISGDNKISEDKNLGNWYSSLPKYVLIPWDPFYPLNPLLVIQIVDYPGYP